MRMHKEPLVAVVTPVHNREHFLAECIESVLRQTYENFEYIIVNDCSTDTSLDIALNYARRDSRIRVESNTTPVGDIDNHNIAFSLISPAAKYCKAVSPEDLIFPDCIRRMVEVAEANPSVGFVASYQLSGRYVKWQGLQYPTAVVPGREICRQVFLGGHAGFGFGTPTSMLYRADLVRSSGGFYPHSSPHSDTSACFKYLQKSDFGFVYQVLSYGRIHGNLESLKSARINRHASEYLRDLIQYGPLYLSKAELERGLNEQLSDYYRFLAVSLVRRRGKDFWHYHRSRLEELGYPIRLSRLLKAAAMRVFREILNPEQAFRRSWRRVFADRKAF